MQFSSEHVMATMSLATPLKPWQTGENEGIQGIRLACGFLLRHQASSPLMTLGMYTPHQGSFLLWDSMGDAPC